MKFCGNKLLKSVHQGCSYPFNKVSLSFSNLQPLSYPSPHFPNPSLPRHYPYIPSSFPCFSSSLYPTYSSIFSTFPSMFFPFFILYPIIHFHLYFSFFSSVLPPPISSSQIFKISFSYPPHLFSHPSPSHSISLLPSLNPPVSPFLPPSPSSSIILLFNFLFVPSLFLIFVHYPSIPPFLPSFLPIILLFPLFSILPLHRLLSFFSISYSFPFFS